MQIDATGSADGFNALTRYLFSVCVLLARIRLPVTSIRISTTGDNGNNFGWDLAGN
jgi:hypothetical protein